MHIAVKIFLFSYIVTTIINFFMLPISEYKKELKKHGKRRAVAMFINSSLICFIPYVIFAALVFFAIQDGFKHIDKWIDKDPTSPKNIKDPKFTPPPPKKKKVKKVKPIEDRFEIIDL